MFARAHRCWLWCATACVFAASLLALPPASTDNIDGDSPFLSDVLAGSALEPASASRLPYELPLCLGLRSALGGTTARRAGPRRQQGRKIRMLVLGIVAAPPYPPCCGPYLVAPILWPRSCGPHLVAPMLWVALQLGCATALCSSLRYPWAHAADLFKFAKPRRVAQQLTTPTHVLLYSPCQFGGAPR